MTELSDILLNSVSVKEAEMQLGYTPKYLRKLISLRKIETVKIGDRVRVPLSEIRRILYRRNKWEIRRRGSKPQPPIEGGRTDDSNSSSLQSV